MFCEQCGIKIGENERICEKCSSIQNINVQKDKKLLISIIFGCSIIFIKLIIILINVLSYGDRIFIKGILQIPMICVIIAVMLSFIARANYKNILVLVSGVLYITSVIFGIINIINWSLKLGFDIGVLIGNINILLIVPAIINIVYFMKLRKVIK